MKIQYYLNQLQKGVVSYQSLSLLVIYGCRQVWLDLVFKKLGTSNVLFLTVA